MRNGDDEWLAIVRWTGYAMLNAEEAGITSKNVEAEAKATKNPDVARLLGTDGEYGKDLKVKKDWVVQIIKQVVTTAKCSRKTSARALRWKSTAG